MNKIYHTYDLIFFPYKHSDQLFESFFFLKQDKNFLENKAYLVKAAPVLI